MKDRGQVRNSIIRGLVIGALLISSGSAGLPAQTPSWPQWRGPDGNGVAPASAPSAWPKALAKAWEVEVGSGYSTPIVAEGKVFVHARAEDRETVTALDALSGRQIWRESYDAPYKVNRAAAGHGPGPKSSPAYADGRLFTYGISGILTAFDASSGKVLWRKDTGEQPEFGVATSPVVADGKLIVFVGGVESGALTAFNLSSGDIVWRWTGGAPAYATPVLATLAGVPQLVTQSRTRVIGVAVADGRLLWQVPFTTSYDQNSVTALVVNDLVIFSGLSKGTTAVRIVARGSAFEAQEVWKNAGVSMYMSSPVAVGTAIVGLSHRNKGQYFALDATTGKTLWITQGREADNAALIRVPGYTLIQTTDAQLIVVRDDRQRFDVVQRYEVGDAATWAHPVLVGNRLFVRDANSLTLWTL
jgi:outer membrane protein assembly factor BamB